MSATPSLAGPTGWRRVAFPESWPGGLRALILCAMATLVIYAGAWGVPFFGDAPADEVVGSSVNVHSREWPIARLFLGLNQAAAKADPRGYHCVSFLLHGVAAGLLFAVLRRTFRPRWGGDRLREYFIPACLGALLWCVHPLQTETVIHVGHRDMVLAAVFIFYSFHAFARGADVSASSAWNLSAIVACGLVMATHPVAAALPILLLLYDRGFIAGSFREAWRCRRGIHLGFAATWVVLVFNLWHARPSGTGWPIEAWGGGFHRTLVQLKLVLWPQVLVFDYGMDRSSAGPIWVLAVSLGIILAVGVLALVRWPRLGFGIAWIVLTLAGGSMLAGVERERVSEHWYYLPIAGFAALIVGALHAIGRRWAVGLAAIAAIALAARAHERVATYRSALTLWTDTVAKAPSNARAHYHLAHALAGAGRTNEAVSSYEMALKLAPDDWAAHFNLADALLQLERADEAVMHYEAALQLNPNSADNHLNLGAALVRVGRVPAGVAQVEQATRLGMAAAAGQRQLGRAFAETGRIEDALLHLEEAVRLDPADADSRVILGMVLLADGRANEGMKQLVEAVVLRPNDPEAHFALGEALIDDGRPAEALVHLEIALRHQPGRAALFHSSMGNALVRLGRAAEAIDHYETALRLNPDDQETKASLERIRAAAIRYNAKK